LATLPDSCLPPTEPSTSKSIGPSALSLGLIDGLRGNGVVVGEGPTVDEDDGDADGPAVSMTAGGNVDETGADPQPATPINPTRKSAIRADGDSHRDVHRPKPNTLVPAWSLAAGPLGEGSHLLAQRGGVNLCRRHDERIVAVARAVPARFAAGSQSESRLPRPRSSELSEAGRGC
jgi:hypothetical protein